MASCWIAELVARLERALTPAGLDLVLDAGPCDGALIRAHLIPRQRIVRARKTAVWTKDTTPAQFRMLQRPEQELVWDERVWVPMCGGPMGNAGHHGMLDAGGVRRLRLVRAWLPSAVEAFAVEYGLEASLERDYGPKEET